MRCVSVVMSCLAVGATSTALAQTASPLAPAPSTQASAPAATAAPAAQAATSAPTAAAPTVYPMDKQMISKGYKPEMRGSERVYCRKEDQIGTHLPPVKTCVTAEAAALHERDAKEYTENAQRMATPPRN